MLFSDIEGSTRLLQQLGTDYPNVLLTHHELLRAAFKAHNGEEQSTEGDSFFVTFPSVRDAVAAALDGQRALANHGWPDGATVRVRVGVHVGTIQTVAGTIVGMAVHEGARIGAAAHGGQVIVSARAAEMANALPDGARWRDLGAHTLKDIPEPVQLFQLDHDELPGDFPPPRSQGATRNNLPAQTSAFIGRDHEVAEVSELLATSRLLTLTGAGGAGKSRLALRVAADQGARFSDGVWFVDLAPVTEPEAIAAQVVSAMGLPESEAASVVNAIGQRHMLLLIDNCEHVVADACALVDELLRGCPNMSVLATSREPLGVHGEVAWRVPSLDDGDAVELFRTRARAVSPQFEVTDENRDVVAEVCTRLDAIPLALELAAARLGSLSVQQLADRLDQRFRLLSGGSRTALARQRTLQATVDWSYGLLEASTQAVLRRLGVFLGGFDLEAAENVCATDGVDRADVYDHVDQLVSKSLVVADDRGGAVRYRLLETIRHYALDRLLDDDEMQSTRDAHANWVIALAIDADPHLTCGGDQALAWLARLDLESANTRAAFEWLIDVQRLHDATVLLHRLFPWFLARARAAEARQWAERLREQPLDAGDRAISALNYMMFKSNSGGVLPADVAWMSSEFAGLAESAFPELAHPGDAYLVAFRRGLGQLGAEEAVSIASAAADAVRGGTPMVRGMTLQALSWTFQNVGNLTAALDVAERSLDTVTGTQLFAGEARGALTAARIALPMGDLDRCERFGEQALAAARKTDDGVLISGATRLLADIRCCRDDIGSARELLLSVLDVAAVARNPRETADVYNHLAWLAVLEGDVTTAGAYSGHAVELVPPDAEALPNILHTAAEVARVGGDGRRAWRLLVDIAGRLDLPLQNSLAAFTLRSFAAIVLDGGDASSAAVLMDAAAAAVPEGFVEYPVVQRNHAALVAQIRKALSDEAFEAATARGAAMPADEALAFAASLPGPS